MQRGVEDKLGDSDKLARRTAFESGVSSVDNIASCVYLRERFRLWRDCDSWE